MSYSKWRIVTPNTQLVFRSYDAALRSAKEISKVHQKGIEITRHPNPFKARKIILNF